MLARVKCLSVEWGGLSGAGRLIDQCCWRKLDRGCVYDLWFSQPSEEILEAHALDKITARYPGKFI